MTLPSEMEGLINIKLKFKSFQPVDMGSPQFSVCMIFGSVQEVRNAIKI